MILLSMDQLIHTVVVAILQKLMLAPLVKVQEAQEMHHSLAVHLVVHLVVGALTIVEVLHQDNMRCQPSCKSVTRMEAYSAVTLANMSVSQELTLGLNLFPLMSQ